MPISLARALDEIANLAGRPEHAAAVAELKARFAERTGAFGPEDAWFEARSRAFVDWLVTRGGFARAVGGAAGDGTRAYVEPLERAHRGLYAVKGRPRGRARGATGEFVLRDAWTGVELEAAPLDPGLADALDAAESPFDGYVVGLPLPEARAHVLPGAIFHSDEAREPIVEVVAAAKKRGLLADDALDALLRMERSLRALSRVKASFAYRVEALGDARPSG
jgi:hypothetical protein